MTVKKSSQPKDDAGARSPPQPQLEEWKKTKETHEQVAVGERTARSKEKTREFLDKF